MPAVLIASQPPRRAAVLIVCWDGRKVRLCRTHTQVRLALDLHLQHRTTPAVFDGLFDVPLAGGSVFELLNDDAVVLPWNLVTKLVTNYAIGPGLGKAGHVLEVALLQGLSWWTGIIMRPVSALAGGEVYG